MDPRIDLDAVEKRKLLILPGLELRFRAARSQSLCRLRYSSPSQITRLCAPRFQTCLRKEGRDEMLSLQHDRFLSTSTRTPSRARHCSRTVTAVQVPTLQCICEFIPRSPAVFTLSLVLLLFIFLFYISIFSSVFLSAIFPPFLSLLSRVARGRLFQST